MKVGDNVYCIKSLDMFGNQYFLIGSEYSICDIRGGLIFLKNKENIKKIMLHCSFSVYFITEKEYRKLKLDKISNL